MRHESVRRRNLKSISDDVTIVQSKILVAIDLWRCDFHKRVFAISSPTPSGQVSTAVVWGHFCDLGDLSLVFSSPLAWRICICTSDRECISPVVTGQSTSRISGDRFALARRHLVFLELTSPSQSFLETGTRGGADPGNRGIVVYQCGPALSSSFQHRAIVTKLVCAS